MSKNELVAKIEALNEWEAVIEEAKAEAEAIAAKLKDLTVKVVAKDEATITFDANHEMAGKELNFRIELVEVK